MAASQGVSVRITGAKKTECPDCNGLGYTDATAADMRVRKHPHFELVEVKTFKLGSGCPRCLGTGQLCSSER